MGRPELSRRTSELIPAFKDIANKTKNENAWQETISRLPDSTQDPFLALIDQQIQQQGKHVQPDHLEQLADEYDKLRMESGFDPSDTSLNHEELIQFFLQQEGIIRDQNPQPVLTRRRFLAAAVATGVVAATAHTGIDSEVRSGLEAALARKTPPETVDKFQELSDDMLSACYDLYFKDRPHILSKHAWERSDLEGFGRWIARIANIYYASEKQPGDSFDSYYERFMQGLHDASIKAHLDFIVFVSSLKVSSENIGTLEQYKSDILPVSAVQTAGVSLARHVDRRYLFQEQFQSYGNVPKLLNTAQKVSGSDKVSRPHEEWNIKAVSRIPSEVTTGMMDFEPSQKARALLLYGSQEIKDIFKKDYPDIVKCYQTILDRQGVDYESIIGNRTGSLSETLSSAKQRLEQSAKDYINRFAQKLDVFVTDDGALAFIGIKVPLSAWQKLNRTDVWYQLMRRRDEGPDEKAYEKAAIDAVKETMRYDFDYNRPGFYETFMSQQILNPQFIQYLRMHAGNQEEVQQLKQIEAAIKAYDSQVKAVRTAFMEAVAHEGHLEYNSRFQQLSSAALTKMLSSEAGVFDPNDKNSLYWNVYRLLANRELAHPFTLVRTAGFAPDVLVDPPYAPKKTLQFLDTFDQMLQKKGVLKKPAYQDVLSMDRAIQAIRQNDFSAWTFLSQQDRLELFEFCKYHIAEGGEVALNRMEHLLGIVG